MIDEQKLLHNLKKRNRNSLDDIIKIYTPYVSVIVYNTVGCKLSKEDINLLEANLYAKIEDLKNKEKFDAFEYEFLTNLYLKDIIVGYFIINNKWLPKDKKLFKSLKDENIELFRLCKKVIETYEYKDLINVYKYIFI